MERTENEVTRQGGLDGVLGSILVPNLTHHDNVGILSEDVAEGRAEGNAHSLVDCDLIEFLPDHFDGVFNRGDVDRGGRKKLQSAIERSGLAAPCGSRY